MQDPQDEFTEEMAALDVEGKRLYDRRMAIARIRQERLKHLAEEKIRVLLDRVQPSLTVQVRLYFRKPDSDWVDDDYDWTPWSEATGVVGSGADAFGTRAMVNDHDGISLSVPLFEPHVAASVLALPTYLGEDRYILEALERLIAVVRAEYERRKL